MSIDFSTLQSLAIPEGTVVKIEDSAGNVIWAVKSEEPSVPIVLEVAKQTASTYAGETGYTDESFVLLDIYPKNASSKVKVTYGGLTKSLTFSGTNAQKVYFGTFHGVSDEVETPASGTLTIEGGCIAIALGTYTTNSKGNTESCLCITAITESGGITEIPSKMFYITDGDTTLTRVNLSECVTSIGSYAFQYCYALTSATIIGGTIGDYAFGSCRALVDLTIGNGVTSIGDYAFQYCEALTSVTIPKSVTSIDASAFQSCGSLTSATLMCPTIGEDMFRSCTALTNVSMAEGVVSIGSSAFTGCDELANIVIPASVTSIEYLAFSYLGTAPISRRITMLSANPPALIRSESGTGGWFDLNTYTTNPDYVFTIVVPKGCGATYREAEEWNTYADYIVEET